MMMREVCYCELRCLDCGNDGSEVGRGEALRPNTNKGFLVTVPAIEDYLLDHDGEFREGGFNYARGHYRWKTLRCVNCGSTNIKRKRCYREVRGCKP